MWIRGERTLADGEGSLMRASDDLGSTGELTCELQGPFLLITLCGILFHCG